MSNQPLQVLAANVAAACSRFQKLISDEHQASSSSNLSTTQHPSVFALTELLREHEELISRLNSCNLNDHTGGRTDDQAELTIVTAKRERVLTQGLDALGSIAISMRAVLDDVGELAPADNGYLPTVQELLTFGHRLRYTTFATMGLYSGEPAPQQLHLDHSALWERALAERHSAMAAAAGAGVGAVSLQVPVDPRAEAACRTLLENLVQAGWTPDSGFPEPVLQFLGDMPGALDVLRRLVEERFFGAKPPPAVAAAGASLKMPATAVETPQPPPPPAANPSSRLVRELMLDEDSDDGGGGDSSSEYTTTEDDTA